MTSAALRPILKAEIARQDLSAAKVAAGVGLTPVAFSRRMRGEVDWTVTELERVAEVLGLDVSALLAEARRSA